DPQRARGAAAVLGGAEIGAEVEELVLDAAEHRILVAARVQPSEAERGVRLVDRAVGLDPERLLWHARAVAERSLALVAAARVDLGELHHRRSAAREH